MVKIKNEAAQHFNYELENLAIGLFYPTTLALIFQLKLPYLPFGELKKNAWILDIFGAATVTSSG